MQTERFFSNRDLSELDFVPLQAQDLVVIENYVEATRHLKEIQQLFQVLRFNIAQFVDKYVPLADGSIRRKQDNTLADSDEDFIAINALLANILSAGRTLTESMEAFDKSLHPEHYGSQATAPSVYRKAASTAYDSSFAYRFFIQMRNYSQHGHLLASAQDGNYFFDMIPILKKPHFTHNGAIEDQIEDFITEVIALYKNEPTLGFTLTLAEYISVLCNLYTKFLPIIWNDILPFVDEKKKVIKSNPQNVFNAGTVPPGFFVYRVDDEIAHAFHLGEKPKKLFLEMKIEAIKVASHFQNEWNLLKNAILTIRLTSEGTDVKGIELGTIADLD